jgi:hypothetical protein
MAKYFGVDAFQLTSVGTTARRLVDVVDAKRFTQGVIIQSPTSNSGPILVGGPVNQIFQITPGSALNLGDLYLGGIKTEIDMYNVWVKASSGTVTINVIFDKTYSE